jgi:hypothetical protein
MSLIKTKHSGYSADGVREYPKGGGSKKAPDYEAARVAERNRQREAFYAGSGYHTGRAQREQQYSRMGQDISNSHRSRLDDEYARAQRNVRMNLARSGLSGSSQEAAELAELKKRYDEGVVDSGSRAEGAIAQARGGYESAISQGVQSINSGSQAATEVAAALAKFSASIQSALEGAKGQSYGGFFDSLGSALENNTLRQQAAAGLAARSPYEDETPGVAPIGGSSSGGGSGRTFISK